MDEATRLAHAAVPSRATLRLAALHEVAKTRATLVALERALVVAAREEYASWRQIGAALGVSGQAAHRRFRGIDPRPPHERDPLLVELDALHGPFERRNRDNAR